MSQTISTKELYDWAIRTSANHEVVALFWKELTKALKLPESATSSEAMETIGKYGGNSIANVLRQGGVSYEHVAYDVANKLRGLREKLPFERGDVQACEDFILAKMKLNSDDLHELVQQVQREAGSTVFQATLRNNIRLTGAIATQKIAAATVAQIANQVSRRIAQRIAQQVASQAAARIAAVLSMYLAAATLISLAGPALRVTIPGTTYTAILRRLHAASNTEI